MDTVKQQKGSGDGGASGDGGGESSRRRSSRHRGAGGQRTPLPYRVSDHITEGLVYAMVLFSPWAFGTTRSWAVWCMNGAAYALGVLLVTKWVVRWRTGYQPERWGESRSGWMPAALASLTVLLLGWCLISAINLRATFIEDERRFLFEPRFIAWLPHSYDGPASWFSFWTYLGMSSSFWAVRDWLLGKTRQERHRQEHGSGGSESEGGEDEPGEFAVRTHEAGAGSGHRVPRIPLRLRRLLWLICINGALVSLEGILQRLDGTDKLLWVLRPHFNIYAELQFGPYAYRANGAQYLNLIWPLAIGFWWTLRRTARAGGRAGGRRGGDAHVVLIPCAVITAAGPIVSTSRGAALVAAGILLGTLAIQMLANRGRWRTQLGILLAVLAGLGLGLYLGWEQLAPRLKLMLEGDTSNRREIYSNSQEMTKEFGWLGSGPGTFGSLYHLYLTDTAQRWEAWAHDDYLETQITFGKLGLIIILATMALCVCKWFVPGGIPASWVLVGSIWLALAGVLTHARVDFPLQVHSVLFLFILLCCVSFTTTRTR